MFDYLPGDAILYNVTPHSQLISRFVAAGELFLGLGRGVELYSHVAIVSDRPGYQWEAKWPRVGEFEIDGSRQYEVWRICDLTDDQRKVILRECAARKGDWYNMIGLFTDGRLYLQHTEVCSQLLDEVYLAAGVEIDREGGQLLAPDDIPDSAGAKKLCTFIPQGG